jgi:hypothetical protein
MVEYKRKSWLRQARDHDGVRKHRFLRIKPIRGYVELFATVDASQLIDGSTVVGLRYTIAL